MNTDIPQPYVSRGGLKLEKALKEFNLDVKDTVVLDVGSSTGGFVDCLLQNGAAKVYSTDTAYGELAWKLRKDERVVVMERTNILHLKGLPLKRHSREDENPQKQDQDKQIPDQVGNDDILVDLITIDASWTKLELILPVVKGFLKENGYIIALLKPHYEAGKSLLVKGVLPDELQEKIINKVKEKLTDLGFEIKQQTDSPILGGGGNRELLLLIKT